MYNVHRQQRAACRSRWPRRCATNDLVVAAVLSGNRNFEGRIHPQVRASYLASPPLVVAYALAGTVDIDLTTEPLGEDPNGQPVYLRDIWPTQRGGARDDGARRHARDLHQRVRARLRRRRPLARAAGAGGAASIAWDAASTYVREPPFFEGMTPEPQPLRRHRRRARARLGRRLGHDRPHLARRLDSRATAPPGSI